jgi:hypothetical protein
MARTYQKQETAGRRNEVIRQKYSSPGEGLLDAPQRFELSWATPLQPGAQQIIAPDSANHFPDAWRAGDFTYQSDDPVPAQSWLTRTIFRTNGLAGGKKGGMWHQKSNGRTFSCIESEKVAVQKTG